jgi:hypothetical protein
MSQGEFSPTMPRWGTAIDKSMWSQDSLNHHACQETASGPTGKEANMSEDKKKTPPEEIAILVKRTGLNLTEEQFQSLCESFDSFEEAAQRLRKGIKRNDELATAFRVPK